MSSSLFKIYDFVCLFVWCLLKQKIYSFLQFVAIINYHKFHFFFQKMLFVCLFVLISHSNSNNEKSNLWLKNCLCVCVFWIHKWKFNESKICEQRKKKHITQYMLLLLLIFSSFFSSTEKNNDHHKKKTIRNSMIKFLRILAD